MWGDRFTEMTTQSKAFTNEELKRLLKNGVLEEMIRTASRESSLYEKKVAELILRYLNSQKEAGIPEHVLAHEVRNHVIWKSEKEKAVLDRIQQEIESLIGGGFLLDEQFYDAFVEKLNCLKG